MLYNSYISNFGRVLNLAMNITWMIVAGIILAVILQILQKKDVVNHFFNFKFFLVILVLSVLLFLVSLGVGSWNGMALGGISFVCFVLSLSGLVTSFFSNLLISK